MKKILYHSAGFFAIVMLLSIVFANTAHAATTFNQFQTCTPGQTLSCDCPTVEVANHTTQEGVASPCWGTSVSATPGQTVNVRVYYHNTGSENAANTSIKLSTPSGVQSTYSFTGSVSADNAGAATGYGTVTISAPESLSFGSVLWYPNQQTSPTPLPLGQTGQEMLSANGLNLGTIGIGWAHQGSVVVSFTVGNSQPPQQQCTINSFAANPSSVISGGTSALSWTTSNCTSVSISGLGSNLPLTGSQSTGPLYGTTSYTITAYGNFGGPASQTVTVLVNQQQQQQCLISYFNANPSTVSYGGTSMLTWSTSNCNSVSISSIGTVSTSGSQTTGPIYGTTTYTLTAYGSFGGPVSQTVTVFANQQQQQQCYINSFTASPTQVVSGGSVFLSFSSTGAQNGTIYGSNNYYTTVPATGSLAVYPTVSGNYTFTINCLYGGQSQSQSVYVSIYNNVPPPPVSTISVVTSLATNITQTSARLNGLLVQSGGYNATGYFQWGTSAASLPGTTTNQNLGNASSVSYYDTVTGLAPNTYYYFRAVASNGTSGTVYGDVEFFKTLGQTVINQPPTVITNTTVVQGTGTGTPFVTLAVGNQADTVCRGDTISQNVVFKNISGKTLTNAILRIGLPKNVIYQTSSAGIYTQTDNTITIPLGSLAPNQDGTIFVSGRLDGTLTKDALQVTTATLVFTSPISQAQETAIAYGLVNANDCQNNNLLGLALFGNGFWPTTLIGWLVLILIIFALVALARYMYAATASRNSRTVPPPPNIPTPPYNH